MMTGKDFYKASHSAAKFVKRGYGQVEPNHLSAQHTGQIYAQLPAAANIEKLENGQFVKYDYAKKVCDFTGAGEWMLVFNEVKVYRDFLGDADFAMIKDNYDARVYSPVNMDSISEAYQSRFLGGKARDFERDENGKIVVKGGSEVDIKKVTAAEDPYEFYYNEDPMHILTYGGGVEAMPEGTVMVPRVFKTNVGDIFTTNMIDEDKVALEDVLSPRAADGILCKTGDGSMSWQVVKVYTMPDGQPGAKLMRIA